MCVCVCVCVCLCVTCNVQQEGGKRTAADHHAAINVKKQTGTAAAEGEGGRDSQTQRYTQRMVTAPILMLYSRLFDKGQKANRTNTQSSLDTTKERATERHIAKCM